MITVDISVPVTVSREALAGLYGMHQSWTQTGASCEEVFRDMDDAAAAVEPWEAHVRAVLDLDPGTVR